MIPKRRILILDDEPTFYHSFKRGYEDSHVVEAVATLPNALAKLEGSVWDAIIVDLNLGKDYNAGLFEVVPPVVAAVDKRFPVLVVTSDTRPATLGIALSLGVQALVRKTDYTATSLVNIIEAHINKRTQTNTSSPTKRIKKKAVPKVENERQQITGFLTFSPAMQALRRRLDALVNYPNAAVLLLGETGVGKEVLANYIHQVKADPELPFQKINLATYSRELVASAIFGYKKGAFTGADTDMPGFFENAGKGTLFIDEIGEIDEGLQVKLLRVLESRTYTRVGDTQLRQLNAQLVFATNKDMEEAVKSGDFRGDLYHRISTLTFTIPPLRERRMEILPLAQHFLQELCPSTNPLADKTLTEVCTAKVLQAFERHDWPGNIRELRNVMQRLVFEVDVQKLDRIDLPLLPRRFQASTTVSASNTTSAKQINNIDALNWPTDKMAAYEDLKRIEKALIQTGGHKNKAAKKLQLKSDQTLRYRVEKKYFVKYPDLFWEFETTRNAYDLTLNE